MDDWNILATKDQVFELAYCIYNSKPHTIRQNLKLEPNQLSNHWFYAFLSHHTEFKFIYTYNKDQLCVNVEDWDVWDYYFGKLKNAMDKYNIKPENLWNMDKKGFHLSLEK